METLNSLLTQLVDLLARLGGLPGFAMVFLFCLVTGFVLKRISRFPNNGIPVAVVLAGMVLNSLIADPRTDALPFRVWIVKNILFGGIIGFLAWLAHNQRRRIPIVKNFIGDDDDPVQTPANGSPTKRVEPWPGPPTDKIGLMLILSFSLFFTACRTASDGTRQFDATRTATVLRTMLPPAVKVAVSQEPSVKPWIRDAQVAVCLLVDTGNVTPGDLKAAIATTGIREINTPESQAVIESVFAIYAATYSDAVAKHLDPTNMVPVLKGICDGLSDGLLAQ